MPYYSYTCKDCQRTSILFFRIAKIRKSVKCPRCGGIAARDVAADHRRHRPTPGNWPHASNAMGVLPDEAEAEQARLRKIDGCASVEVNKKGQIVTHSANQRRRVMRALGMHDLDAYY